MSYQLIDNKEKKRYEFSLPEHTPLIEYIRTKDKIYLTHTEVPTALEGQGIGTELVKQVLDDIKQKDLELVPLCPFVAAYIKKHPEYKALVLKGINIA
jgi:predicted GNAT family acetyltransferase